MKNAKKGGITRKLSTFFDFVKLIRTWLDFYGLDQFSFDLAVAIGRDLVCFTISGATFFDRYGLKCYFPVVPVLAILIDLYAAYQFRFGSAVAENSYFVSFAELLSFVADNFRFRMCSNRPVLCLMILRLLISEVWRLRSGVWCEGCESGESESCC